MLKLLKYLKPFWLPITLSLILMTLRSLSDLYLPTLTADMVNIGIVNGDVDYIIAVGAQMIAFASFGTLFAILAGYISAKAGNGFAKLLRDKVFERIESFSLQEFDRFGTSSLITRTTNDINQVRMIMDFGLRMMVMAPIMSIGSIIMAFTRDARLALIFVVAVPILGLTIYLIMQKGLPLFAQMQNKLDSLNLVLREGLTGIRVVRAFNRDPSEEQRFQSVNSEYTRTATRVNRIMGATMPIVALIMNFSILAIVWFGGIRIDGGHMQVGDLMAFIQYAMLVMASLVMLTRVFIMIPRAVVSAKRIGDVLNTVPEITDPAYEQSLSCLAGDIEFENVTFKYPGAEIPALQSISFRTRPGQKTAIIGGTGSGKSTLAGLLLRLYDVTDGSIKLGGADIRELKQETLRAQIGYVPQKAVLFSGTIRENIAYGNDNAGQDEIEQAARTAQAFEFIKAMPKGMDSPVAQGGKSLSGGQKQRLAIARALVRKPAVYLFDDSFSALDYKTDARLRTALFRETGQSSVLIISQRVSTIMDADQIIVLENGRIEGVGSHDDLLKTCQTYSEIVSTQLSGEVQA